MEVIRAELTAAELARKYDIRPTMISGWKLTAIANMASSTGAVSPAMPQIPDHGLEKLHAKIVQLVIERDFLSVTSSFIPGAGGKKR